jgi:hypothetical protein
MQNSPAIPCPGGHHRPIGYDLPTDTDLRKAAKAESMWQLSER